MKVPTRLLGIDYGSVRIGLAISDPDRKIASPLVTYTRRGRAQDADYLGKLVAEEDIGQIILGLPIHLSGHESQSSDHARAFGKWLAELTGLPVLFWDERFTTVEAEAHLLTAGLTKKRRKSRRDRVAAQILLQSYLDAGSPEEPRPERLDH